MEPTRMLLLWTTSLAARRHWGRALWWCRRAAGHAAEVLHAPCAAVLTAACAMAVLFWGADERCSGQ